MAPTVSTSSYYASINETLSVNAQDTLPYTHGLTGVNLAVNDIST